MKQLNECLNNEYGSYIIPFFWQHGDSKDELLEEIIAIEKSGAKEICVESRVYEDFCKDNWWDDFGFILEEAKKRNIGIWLLDDKKFPTGYANGLVEMHPELRKKHLRLAFIDVVGPKIDVALIVPQIDEDNERIVSISAYKRTAYDEVVSGEPINLTDKINDGLIFWDIPDGMYRIFYTIETTLGNAQYFLIDMLNPDACRLMLEAVYEPHYDHFKEYFGNTFKGFFSDEPCFGNGYGYDCILGKDEMLVPFCCEAIEMVAEKMKKPLEYVLCLLPLLWNTHTDKIHNFRYCYMDVITSLYKRNFSDMLGNWCREHNVMYIGHIIEDDNAHMRLGYGPGHFFRALSGQDYSGCDIVLNQMIPGMCEQKHAAPVFKRRANPEFFRYTLAKLCVSDSHLDEKKKGRALCEIFGAFGWAEGVPMMKNLADHMLVSGINHFVLHAFSNRFPNPDCPPHFYCKGNNPQFEYFTKLTKYMQRTSHMLYGGRHINNIAVLYNCEAEWCAGDYDLFQKISKILIQHQLDFDFVPSDYLENPKISNGSLVINGEEFKAIVVSRATVLPKNLVEKLNYLADNGVQVIVCGQLPEKYADSDDVVSCHNYTVVKYSELVSSLEVYGDIYPSKECKYLRYYHTVNDNKDVYMFTNEDIYNGLEVDIRLSHGGEYIKYDAWENEVKYGKTDENVYHLRLGPSGACMIIFSEHGNEIDDRPSLLSEMKISPKWEIALENRETFESEKLENLAPQFSKNCGIIKYHTRLSLDIIPKKLCFENIGEIAIVYINGHRCKDAIFAPFEYDVEDFWLDGENEIIIEVIPNLGYKYRDGRSSFLSLPPMGLVGSVSVKY